MENHWLKRKRAAEEIVARRIQARFAELIGRETMRIVNEENEQEAKEPVYKTKIMRPEGK